MVPKTPSFWSEDGWIAQILKPLSAVYLAGHAWRQKRMKSYRPSVPVICVGGAVVGGSGKTPCAQALTQLLLESGVMRHPAILSRGYGGKSKGPLIVTPQIHTYRDVGDEALLHARTVTTIVSRDRAAGAQWAERHAIDGLVLDDGLQNLSLEKTIAFLVVDARQGFGNGMVVPAGPLREPLEETMEKTDAIVLIGDGLKAGDLAHFRKPVFTARIDVGRVPKDAISQENGDLDNSSWEKKAWYGFAGLGRPEKFKETLEKLGVSLAGWRAFPDHHPYSKYDMTRLVNDAEKKKAHLITTEKDYVRLPFYGKAPEERLDIETLGIRLVFDAQDAVKQYLRDKLATFHGKITP